MSVSMSKADFRTVISALGVMNTLISPVVQHRFLIGQVDTDGIDVAEHVAGIAVQLRSLVIMDGVLDRQWMQSELFGHDLQVGFIGIEQIQPQHGVFVGGEPLAHLLRWEPFVDDHNRYASSRARENYSGQSPIARASGKKSVVLARYAINRRLGAALHLQAFAALNGSPGARAYYDAMRARDISHHAALRQLANSPTDVGILHGCLKTGTLYNENTAWQRHEANKQMAAA